MKHILSKLRLFLAGCFLAGLLAVLIYALGETYTAYTQLVVEQRQEHLLITARAVGQSLELYISEHLRDVDILTRTPGFLDEFRGYYATGENAGLKEYLLSYILSQQQGVSRVYLLDRDGQEIYRYNQYPFLEDFDEGRLRLKELSDRRRSRIGTVFRLSFQHYGFTLVNAIMDGNDYAGAVVCVMDMEPLYRQFVAPLDLQQTGKIIVRNDKGTVMMHPDSRMLTFNPFRELEELDTLPQYASLREMLNKQYSQEEGAAIYQDYSNGILPPQKEITAFSRMNYGGVSWYVSAVLPYSEITHLVDSNMGRFGLLVGAIIAVMVAGILTIYALQKNRQKLRRETEYLKTMNRTLEELHHSKEQVRHYQKLQTIGALAGGIVHEFNNLLTPIIGYSEFLKDQLGKDSEYYEDMDEILKAGTRAKEIVDQILPFSRLETDSSGYQLISMDAVLRDALKMVRMIIPPKYPDGGGHWQLARKCVRQRHPTASGSVEPVLQCLSVYGTQRRVLTVSVRRVPLAKMTQPAGNAAEWVCIQVSDTGCGIPEDDLKHIFDPFFTTKAMGEGTGLGLSVVQDILISHGGHITADSTPGTGSRFTIWLPAAGSAEK